MRDHMNTRAYPRRCAGRQHPPVSPHILFYVNSMDIGQKSSGRVLAEVFKDEASWSGSVLHSMGSDCTSSPQAEQVSSEANSHLNGLEVKTGVDANGCEQDDLLLYASAKRETPFSNTRINICSKNGTIRGVRHKVSAGQELFNSLSSMYSGSLRHQKRRPWEKQ